MHRTYPLVSLFAGIGGLDLGLEATGRFSTTIQVELDPYCRRVLARRFPLATRYTDVRTFDPANVPPNAVICGGFPCQDLSHAPAGGAGAGLDGERSGLWYEFARVIAASRPLGVVIENSPRLERRGLDTVVGFLDEQGYAVEASIIAAGDVGAPQRRQRLFVIAWRRPLGNAHREGQLSKGHAGQPQGRRRSGHAGDRHPRSPASEPSVGRGADGFPTGLDGRWPVGRGVAQHPWEPPRTVAPRSVPDRKARMKALGNAVVPAVAYQVGLRLAHHLTTY